VQNKNPLSKSPPSTNLPDTLTHPLCIRFALIPAGIFDMGSKRGSDERPVHRVRLSRPFYMSRYEITQEQWTRVMGTAIEQQRDRVDPTWELRGKGSQHPVYYVTWHDAQAFVERLNHMEGKSLYRLPTEAEWEYACRAGSSADVVTDLDAVAWYGPNADGRTHPVGQKLPNAYGLYDMHGNVWEWCGDWYGPYTQEEQTAPKGPTSGEFRVVRGGCWHSDADGCRAADWVAGTPDRANSSLGIRIVRSAE